jgi:hypothetical protein
VNETIRAQRDSKRLEIVGIGLGLGHGRESEVQLVIAAAGDSVLGANNQDDDQ